MSKISRTSTDEELMDAFTLGNNAGRGFGVGLPAETPAQAATTEEYVILRDIERGTNNPGEPVFCEDGDDLIVIANIHGPWAVSVGRAEDESQAVTA